MTAVRAFQEDNGLPDGVAGGDTMRAINTAPEERLKSIMVAMERERWLNLPDGRGKRVMSWSTSSIFTPGSSTMTR